MQDHEADPKTTAKRRSGPSGGRDTAAQRCRTYADRMRRAGCMLGWYPLEMRAEITRRVKDLRDAQERLEGGRQGDA